MPVKKSKLKNNLLLPYTFYAMSKEKLEKIFQLFLKTFRAQKKSKGKKLPYTFYATSKIKLEKNMRFFHKRKPLKRGFIILFIEFFPKNL